MNWKDFRFISNLSSEPRIWDQIGSDLGLKDPFAEMLLIETPKFWQDPRLFIASWPCLDFYTTFSHSLDCRWAQLFYSTRRDFSYFFLITSQFHVSFHNLYGKYANIELGRLENWFGKENDEELFHEWLLVCQTIVLSTSELELNFKGSTMSGMKCQSLAFNWCF